MLPPFRLLVACNASIVRVCTYQTRHSPPNRRTLLTGIALNLPAAHFLAVKGAVAARFRSVACDRPAVLHIINSTDRTLKVYWIGYDGDEELFAVLPPGAAWTVDTYETHAWRLTDAGNGKIVNEFIAQHGDHSVNIDDETTQHDTSINPTSDVFIGFDGVGGEIADYAAARVTEVDLDHLGALVMLEADGYDASIPLPLASIEAVELFHASSAEFRRPTTITTWIRTLQAAGATVERILVSRLVGTTYYARIIIRLPGDGGWRSIDARPSDALAVAMRSKAPIFVSRRIAAARQPGSLESKLGMYEDAEPPVPRRDEIFPSLGAPEQGYAIKPLA